MSELTGPLDAYYYYTEKPSGNELVDESRVDKMLQENSRYPIKSVTVPEISDTQGAEAFPKRLDITTQN